MACSILALSIGRARLSPRCTARSDVTDRPSGATRPSGSRPSCSSRCGAAAASALALGRFAGPGLVAGPEDLVRIVARDEGLELLAVDGLFLDEQQGDLVQLVAVLGQDRLAVHVGLVHDPADLDVDLLGGLVGVLLAHAVVASHEGLSGIVAEGERPEVLAHAVLSDHAARGLGGPLQIVGGARW